MTYTPTVWANGGSGGRFAPGAVRLNADHLNNIEAGLVDHDAAIAALESGAVGDTITPETYGAVGDGTTDDTTALTDATAALGANDTLSLTQKYRHSDTVTIAAAGATVAGGGELIGTSQTSCALVITADDVTVEDITLSVINVTARQTTPETAGLYLNAVDGFTGRNIMIENSSSVGVMILGASSYFTLENITVAGSWADGIHMTEASHHGKIINPTIIDPGDDGVAVVSYLSDGAACHDIDIVNTVVRNGKARGVSVVGGTDINYYGVNVRRTAAAGIFIACEDNVDWQTYEPIRVNVKGFFVEGAAWDIGNADHPSVFVLNESATLEVQAVAIGGGTVRDSLGIYRVAVFQGGTGGHTGCTLNDVTFEGRLPRLLIDNSGGTLTESNINYGVRQFVPHPSETSITSPNGSLYGAAGSTATTLNGTTWIKTTSGITQQGWISLATGADGTPPTTPGSFAATAGSGQVALTWTASTDAVGVSGYHVWRAPGDSSPGQLITTTASLSYTNTGLTAGQPYAYQVSAYDAAGNEGSRTETLTRTPT